MKGCAHVQSPIEVSVLTDLATRFRALLESRRDDLPAVLAGFPQRGLEQACDLLGQYLRKEGVTSVSIASGACPGAVKHWWVETEGFVVDLAARERDGDLPVVVVTRAATWEVTGPVERRAPRPVVPDDVAKILVAIERS